MIETLLPNQSHSMEHEADVFGYLLLRNAVAVSGAEERLKGEATIDNFILMNTIGLFDLMYLLGGTGSESHPDSLSREIVLVETVYGREAANLLSESYQDTSKIKTLLNQNTLPIIDVNQFINSRISLNN